MYKGLIYDIHSQHSKILPLRKPQDMLFLDKPTGSQVLHGFSTAARPKEMRNNSGSNLKKILILCCSPKRISTNKSVEDSSDRAQEVQGFSGRLGLITASV